MFKKLVGFVVTATLAAGVALVTGSAPSAAQKVANPGSIVFTFESGEFKLGNETADAADSDDPITATGNLAANGTLTFSGLSFPPIEVENTSGVGPNPIVVRVLPQQIPAQAPGVVGFGSLDPLTGIASVQFRIAVKIDGFSDDCYIGTPGSPILLNLTTETSGSQTGVRYNTTNGLLTIVDGVFAVPGASGCEFAFISVNGQINSELGLPSPSGNNYARLTASTSPIAQRAIRPSFTATPSSGFAPLDVDFDAAATFAAASVASYQWDLDNDGAYDDATGVTTSRTYPTPGVHTIGLRVVDSQGDSATTSRQITVNTPSPDLTITKTDGGSSFVTGADGTYTIGVSNVGSAATSGAITVSDTLPAGLTFVSGAGAGWSCGAVGQDVTCTNAGPLGVAASLDDLVLTVNADGSVTGPISNTATVATDGDLNGTNNSATDTGQIIQAGIDLAIDKTHDLDDGLLRGERATYTLAVSNVGTAPAVARIRISDTLPAGVTFVSASGVGWVCNGTTTVACFTDTDLAPGNGLPAVNIRVDVDGDAPATLSNTATVSVDGDANEGNDSDTDVGDVLGLGVDYAIDKAHIGDLVAGEPAVYSIGVTNVGTANGGNPVTVTDVLPAGLTFESAVGDGWSCGEAVPGTVVCTHPGGVEAGDPLPKITLRAVVANTEPTSITNTATVSSDGDANPENDSASDPGDVRRPRPDLEISKAHVANFRAGSNGTYIIGVRNVAVERADGVTTVTDTLPAPFTFVSAAGSGWTCGAVGQTVTCDYAATIPGGAFTPTIAIVVSSPVGSEGVVTNTASVANVDDTNVENNSASDPTRIDPRGPAPTELVAEAIVVRLDVYFVGLSLQTKLAVLAGPRATLTSLGVPVPGKTVTFRTLSGQPICSANTDSLGRAICNPSLPALLAALTSLRYSATFAGDLDYQADADEGALIHINGVRLI